MQITKSNKKISRFLLFQIILIGLLYSAAAVFGFIEAEFFNTYLDHVLELNVAVAVPIMVNLSAVMGLVMNLCLGILSDNTRTRFGRRKPYLISGGLIAGTFMFLFAYSPNFFICIIIDVIIIGIASNAFYVAQRALIPDVVEIEKRGRANGIAWIFFIFGMVFSLALFLILNEFFGTSTEDGVIIRQEGYVFALGIGGIFTIITSLIGFFFIKEKKPHELPPKRSFFKDFKDIFNIEELRENKDFYKLVIAMTIFNSGIAVIQPFLFIYIFSLGFATTDLLLILGIAMPFLLIIIYLLGQLADKYGRKKFIIPTILLACIGFYILPFLNPSNILSIPFYIIGFLCVLINIFALLTPLNALSQDLLPEDKRGKFLGILNIIQTISQNIGVSIGGLAIAFLGDVVWIFAIAPIFFILSIPIFLKVKETLPSIDQ